MSKSDLAPIRERLETLKRTSGSPPEVSEPLWDQPRSPELPLTNPPEAQANSTQLAATVHALQRRSPQGGDLVSPPETAAPSAAAIPPEVNLHWQRLQQEAMAINELAQKQAIAMQSFKRSADRLAWSLRRQPANSDLQFEQFCELHEAVISQVLQDEQGKLILANVAIDLHQDERQASQTAQEIRTFSQSRSQFVTDNRRVPESGRDPMAALDSLWQTLTRTLEERSNLTPLDIVICSGGGLISRIALELALAAVPGLWPWLVGAMVGVVALGLYRLLLLPRPDIAFVTRLFLALVGLAIGGQL